MMRGNKWGKRGDRGGERVLQKQNSRGDTAGLAYNKGKRGRRYPWG